MLFIDKLKEMIVFKDILAVNNLFVKLIIIFLILNIITWLMALRQQMLMRFLGSSIRHIDSYKVIVLASIGSYLTPFLSGSFLARTLLVSYYSRISKSKSLFIASYGETFEFMFLALNILVIIFMVPSWLPVENKSLIVATLVLLIILITLFGVFFEKIGTNVISLTRLLPYKIKKPFINRGLSQKTIQDNLEKLKEVIRSPKLFFKLLYPTIPQFLLVGILLMWASKLFDVDITFGQAFVIYWVPTILGKLSGIPGGVGTQDVTMGALLVNCGIDLTTAAKITSTYRFITIFYIFAIGGIIILFDGKKLVGILIKRKETPKP